MPFDKKKIPAQLIKNFQESTSAFFVGAGLSLDAGFPTWTGLLKELIEESKKLEWIPEEKLKEYEEVIDDSSKFLFLAEDIKSELGAKYHPYMEERFGKLDVKPTETHELLVKIKSNLIITINYDRLIENAYNKFYGYFPGVFSYKQPKEAANFYWKNKFFILKAHGDASSDTDGLILSQRDYRKVLYRNPGYRTLLQSIFSTRSMIFLGVSLADPEFNQLLDYLHDSYHGGGPTHYILLDRESTQKAIAKRYLEEFNIETIFFDNPNKDFVEIKEFLQLLLDELGV